jgi:hypothetical protein
LAFPQLIEFILEEVEAAAKFINQLTGWTGSSNEDKRDAGLLALYG